MIVDSTLLEVLHPRQVSQSAGFDGAAWVRWGSFSLYGVKVHMVCATNRVPISYELSAANVAEVKLTGELLEELEEASGILVPKEDLARRLLGDLAYQSEASERELAKHGIALVTERARQYGVRHSRWR